MQPDLHSRFASERLKDDHGRVEPEPDGSAVAQPETITIRSFEEGDAAAVELVAELDERPVPPGPLLVAEIEGTVEAAVGMSGGETIANPFAACADVVELLQTRAEQLRAA